MDDADGFGDFGGAIEWTNAEAVAAVGVGVGYDVDVAGVAETLELQLAFVFDAFVQSNPERLSLKLSEM